MPREQCLGRPGPIAQNLIESWLARVLPVLAIERGVWAAHVTPALIGLGAHRCHTCAIDATATRADVSMRDLLSRGRHLWSRGWDVENLGLRPLPVPSRFGSRPLSPPCYSDFLRGNSFSSGSLPVAGNRPGLGAVAGAAVADRMRPGYALLARGSNATEELLQLAADTLARSRGTRWYWPMPSTSRSSCWINQPQNRC